MVRLSVEGLGFALESRDFPGCTSRNARTVDEVGAPRVDRRATAEPDSLFDDGDDAEDDSI